MYMPFSIVATPIYIPTNGVGGLLFLHILSSVLLVDFLMMVTDWCEVICHCSFDLHFSNN